LVIGAILAGAAPVRAQFGLVLSGAGPINRSMGGVATAAPVDSLGALYWNPAVITGLPSSESEFGAEILYPRAHLSSSVPAGALGPGVPPVGLSGSNDSSNGVMPLPTIGVVYQPEGSILSYGFGIVSAGGFSVNYPSSVTNPILTPQPPKGIGLGDIYSDLQVMQILPTLAVRLTDRLSFGFAPSINLAYLSADPGFLFSPGPTGYPPATHSQTIWGAGFQTGLFYWMEGGWNFGASFKSPQWFDSFKFQTINAMGLPQTLKFNFNYPLMASIGTSYTGFDRWTLGTDLRFIDYRDTPGFSQTGFDATGAVRGLGWRGIFVLALGAQYQVTDPLFLRMGYTFNTNPISDANTIFNVASPTIIQHTLYMGASYQISRCFMVSAAYAHAFENSIQGPIITPFGPVPGSSVQSSVWADTFVVGATVKF
jgi:long-chain fatty acid transport protein